MKKLYNHRRYRHYYSFWIISHCIALCQTTLIHHFKVTNIVIRAQTYIHLLIYVQTDYIISFISCTLYFQLLFPSIKRLGCILNTLLERDKRPSENLQGQRTVKRVMRSLLKFAWSSTDASNDFWIIRKNFTGTTRYVHREAVPGDRQKAHVPCGRLSDSANMQSSYVAYIRRNLIVWKDEKLLIHEIWKTYYVRHRTVRNRLLSFAADDSPDVVIRRINIRHALKRIMNRSKYKG